MRRFLTALTATFVLTLLGPVAVAFAAASEQPAGGDNPVTGTAASENTNGGTAGGQSEDGGGGGEQDIGGQSSTAQTDTNGPAEGPSHVQGSNAPTQDTSSSSDATVDNGAGVDQSSAQGVIGSTNEPGHDPASSQGGGSGQGQGAGNGEGQGDGNGNGNGNEQGNDQGNGQGTGNGNGNGVGQGQQQAQAGQQATASAAAVTSGSTNDVNSVLVGPAAVGDNGATLQTNTATAAADATATQDTTQTAGSAQAGAEQSATAAAQAQATDPENVAISTRIEAPGNDGPVGQSNVISADAEAVTQSQGSETTQQATAAAQSQLESPSNVAVELRVFSDGDSAGGEQINSSSAAANTITDGGPGQTTADATLTNPNNTFVSIRVNSDGETGAVEQENQTHKAQNGVISTTSDAGHSTAWSGADAESGVAVGLITDGDNTDMRITVDNASLDRPSEGATFTWTWDLVAGEDGLACDVQSSSSAGRVDWNFDCDPDDLITREPGSEPTPVAGSMTWTWDWSRPDLAGWDWSRQNTIVLPDCTGCTYVIDFRWITREPTAPAAATAQNATPAATDGPVSVRQSNVASASASAIAGSGISQTLSQTSEGGADSSQSALQTADVLQIVTATAGAELRNATNQLIVAHGLASQWNWAEVVVKADATAFIRQQVEQFQSGTGSLQVQAALQSAQFTQLVNAIGAAAVRDGKNRSISRRGDGIQSTSSKSQGNGRAGASVEQLIVQVQVGYDAEQLQVAGQWATVVQHVDLGAAAALAIGLNGSRLDTDMMNQRIGVASSSRNTATATITQSAIQLQDADGLPQSQESFQTAQVQQTGVALATTDAGRIEHSYATPPTATPSTPSESESSSVSTVSGTTRIVIVGSNGATEISVTGVPTPAALPAQPSIVNLPSPDGSARQVSAPATVFTFTQSLASTRDPLARVKDVKGVEASSPRLPGSAPEHLGASAASAGNGGPGALAALTALTLIRLPRRGRRLFSPAGRRPAVVLLRQERPG